MPLYHALGETGRALVNAGYREGDLLLYDWDADFFTQFVRYLKKTAALDFGSFTAGTSYTLWIWTSGTPTGSVSYINNTNITLEGI